MRDLFLIAAQHQQSNLMFYVPRPRLNEATPAMTWDDMKSWYKSGEFDLALVVFNFHHLHIRPKEIKQAIHSLRYIKKHISSIEPNVAALETYIDQFEQWQLTNSLHTQAYSKTLIVSADNEVFMHLARLADGFTHIEDNAEYNYDTHSHADDIGTSESNGLNFFYYFNP